MLLLLRRLWFVAQVLLRQGCVRGGSGSDVRARKVRTTIRNTYLLLCGPRSASRARTMIRTREWLERAGGSERRSAPGDVNQCPIRAGGGAKKMSGRKARCFLRTMIRNLAGYG